MNLTQLGERGFIEEIRRRFGKLAPPPPAGIGDDAAVLPRSRAATLITTDCLVEQQHFLRDAPPFLLGRKSLAVNLSDIAAMGGRPESFLLTLAIPSGLPAGYLNRFFEGLLSSASEHAVRLVGGDTSASPGPFVISITLVGSAAGARSRPALTRAGARPGDGIYLSGPLGGSAAGRLLLEAGWRVRLTRDGRIRGAVAPSSHARRRPKSAPRDGLGTRAAEALRLHLDPTPRLALGRELLKNRIASAAIDVSDGLSIDLSRLASASGVGARLMAPAIPIADAARAVAADLAHSALPSHHADPLRLALHGGEDYELLFTAPESASLRLWRIGAVQIGRIVARRLGITLADARDRTRALRPDGFDHFRSR